MLFELYFFKWLGEFADAHKQKPRAEPLPPISDFDKGRLMAEERFANVKARNKLKK
jgi:hypothetical protein